MKKLRFTLLGVLIVTGLAFAANSKKYEDAEAREYNAETCDRMEKNWDSHAEAWCRGSGGVDWNNTAKTCKEDGRKFTKVTGRITCNK